MNVSQMSKKRKNFTLILISLMVGIIYYIPYIRFYFYDQTMVALQITNTQLGMLSAIYGLVALFMYPVSGLLTEKFGPKILLTIAFIGTALFTFWESTYPSYTILIVINIAFAFFTTATLWSPYVVLVRNLGSADEQGKLFGYSESLRGVASTLIGFAFVWIFGLAANMIAGFKTVIIAGGWLYVLCAIVAFFLLPGKINDDSSINKESSTIKTSNAVKACLKLPGVWLVSLFIFCGFCVVNAGTNYLGTYTTQIIGIPANISSVFSIIRTSVIPVVAGIIGGILADKFPSRVKFIQLLLLCTAISCAALPFIANSTYIAIVLTMFIALFFMMIKSIYFSVMGDGGIPLELTAVASGVISFIAFIPDAFMTTIMGMWLDHDLETGFNMILTWMSFFSIAAIVIGYFIIRRTQKTKDSYSKEEVVS
ncbi:MAG: MFS transporter [Eubacterium sp.]